MLHRPPPAERGALVGRVSGGGFPARREADGPRRGREGACGCGGLAGPREGFTPSPAPASFLASRSQTDPGLPTESSLHLGPRSPAPPPQLWVSLVVQIVKNPPAIQGKHGLDSWSERSPRGGTWWFLPIQRDRSGKKHMGFQRHSIKNCKKSL